MHALNADTSVDYMDSRVVEKHLKNLISDLECETPTDGKHVELRSAVLLGLKDAHTAIRENLDVSDKTKLHRGLITALYDFNQRWDDWIAGLKPGDLEHGASKQFHEMLLRFSKGIGKAWRIWRIDRLK